MAIVSYQGIGRHFLTYLNWCEQQLSNGLLQIKAIRVWYFTNLYMIVIVTDKKRHVIAVYISVVDKQQIKEGNDDREGFIFRFLSSLY